MSGPMDALTIALACLFGGAAVFGILFPWLRTKKKNAAAEGVEPAAAEAENAQEPSGEEDDSALAAPVEDIGDQPAEALSPEEELPLPHRERTGRTYIYAAAAFLLTVAGCLWLMFYFNHIDVVYVSKRVCLISVLFVAAYYDYLEYRIPNKLILFGLACRAAFLIFELFNWSDETKGVLIGEGMAVAAMAVLSIVCLIIIRKGIGMGDIKLFLIMALMQGISGILSSLFATLLVAFVFSVIMLIAKKKTRKDFIAFGPCILIGTLISMALLGA